MLNTIVAGNTGTLADPDANGAFTSLGNNLIGDAGAATGFTDGVAGDQVGTVASPIDPKLGPLQDNGGPTWTHGLLKDSPALDAGTNTGTPATDQRGAVRTVDGDGDGVATADVGAMEFGFLVNTTEDTVDANPGDGYALDAGGNTSLCAAIMEANALAGHDAIIVPAGTYKLTLTSGATEDARGDLDVTDDLALAGAGMGSTIIDANAVPRGQWLRVFHVGGTTVSIRDVTITGGDVRTGSGGGAGVLNQGYLTLTNTEVTGNLAGGNNAWGAGIANWGSMTIIDSIVSNNEAWYANYGAGICTAGSDLTITGSTISNNTNTGTTEDGGGIFVQWNAGPVNISNTTFANNDADKEGGDIRHSSSNTVTVTDCTFTGSSSGQRGGAISVGSNEAFGGNGTLILERCTITDSISHSGGAIHIENSSTTIITDSTLSGNRGATEEPSTRKIPPKS